LENGRAILSLANRAGTLIQQTQTFQLSVKLLCSVFFVPARLPIRASQNRESESWVRSPDALIQFIVAWLEEPSPSFCAFATLPESDRQREHERERLDRL